MDLKIEYLPIKELKPYEKNARKHADADVSTIMKSIQEFGFKDPIGIWSDKNIIVEGHGRLLAAKRLGLKKVPVIRLDDLTDEQRRAYALAHNKTAEMSEWDSDLLDEELDGILDIDMSDFGFDLSEDEEEKEVVEVDTPEPPEEPKSHYGQIYQLGRHRLMCGDSTKMADVKKLLDGKKADCVVTDPPYNMGYEGAGNTKDRASKKIMNDKMPEADFKKFLLSVYKCYLDAMKDGASIYVFYKELGSGVFMQAMREGGLTFKQELIWVKSQLVLGGSKYQSMYEPCLMGCKGKSIKVWNGGRKQRSVIESIDLMTEEELRETLKDVLAADDPDVIREKKQLHNDLHPTMKPVRLIAKLTQNSSDAGDVILDLFGGSGTTLIAAEQIDRTAYLMELDPRYVDVIIQRYEDFTGDKAVLLTKEEE
ncbi:MAG: site-specific DNA-methyltransferase [Lachnospiraceae bacterium]|nr:site-specific DNA-methyltransferase [Lachnospiraceae bacterium]